jgi:hypothetical protein
MLDFRKSVRLILFTTVPFAVAQMRQVQPAPQPVPAATVTPAAVTNNVSAPDGAATVNYVRGQLTVISQNAPLELVLKLVAAKTGATVGLAPELQNEPVIAQIGPGSVHDVVTRLLDSPKIDYILLGKGDDPDNLSRIVVQSRRGQRPGETQATRTAAYRPPQEDEDTRTANGNLSEDESHMSQDELRERWRKIREEKLAAEIRQQKEDREREANGSANDAEQQPPPQTVQPQQQPQNQETRPQ